MKVIDGGQQTDDHETNDTNERKGGVRNKPIDDTGRDTPSGDTGRNKPSGEKGRNKPMRTQLKFLICS